MTKSRRVPPSSSYDVVIAGGSAVGSATALFLALEPGFSGRVLVVERDWSYEFCAAARSNSSIRQQFSSAINVQLSLFGASIIRDFPNFAATDEPGPDLNFRQWGYLFLACDSRQASMIRANHRVQQQSGGNVALYEGAALYREYPFLRADRFVLGSVGLSNEGWYDNMGLVLGMRAKARFLGVDYVDNAVVGLEVDNKRVGSVRLESGDRVHCGSFVNATGAHAASIAAMAGIELPVEPRKRALFVVDCPDYRGGPMPMVIAPDGSFARPERETLFIWGGTPTLDGPANPDDFDTPYEEFDDILWPALAQCSPLFERVKLQRGWACHYEYNTLDQNGIIGAHPVIRNFYFGNGFSGHGLQQSPATGRALSELIAFGDSRSLDVSALGYELILANAPLREKNVL